MCAVSTGERNSESSVITLQGPCGVSHIPRNVSVGSSVAYTSKNSLSSEDFHPFAPSTCISDNETVKGVIAALIAPQTQDSSNESSSRTLPLRGQKRKDDSQCCRKISISDSDGESWQSGKKSRLEAPHQNTMMIPPSPRMLARPEDTSVLNPLHVFVRQQIESFTANPSDMAQPSPGRKNAIRLHQVGLRCVHCRSLPARDRVKRAVCYPSSVGRVYHSVSDMKFDHFSTCRGLSPDLRTEFDALKAKGKRGGDRGTASGSSTSTAQYYHDSALRMGMEDRREGIFMAGQVIDSVPAFRITPQVAMHFAHSLAPNTTSFSQQDSRVTLGHSNAASAFSSIPVYHSPMAAFHYVPHGFSFRQPPVRVAPAPAPVSRVTLPDVQPHTEVPPAVITPRNAEAGSSNGVLLAAQTDPQYLNPLHCFVRRNVEVFVATKDDIAAPSPGRKNRVTSGQVGIRCVHCAKLPPKSRVKRSVCYPPSVSGIYHSVSNMKFDHFGSCRGLPDLARQEFSELRSSFKRRGGSTSNGSRGMSNSTAQYYHDSALRLGLADSADGIRFAGGALNQPNQKGPTVPDGISALMIAATNQIMLAEYDRNRAVSISGV